jgi:hypothetical protein
VAPRVRAAPSPYDLFDAPELASADAPAAVLDIAVVAVVAASPELLAAEVLDGRGPPSAQVWIADAIVAHAHAHALGAALDRYGVAVELARSSVSARRRPSRMPFDPFAWFDPEVRHAEVRSFSDSVPQVPASSSSAQSPARRGQATAPRVRAQ